MQVESGSLFATLKLQQPADARDELWNTYNSAMAFVRALPHATDGEDGLLAGDDHSAVAGCVVFLARLVTQLGNGQAGSNSGLPLSAIAAAAGTNPFDVFREWPVVSAKLAPWLESRNLSVKQLESMGSIPEWQKTLVAIALLSKKYKDLFNKFLNGLPEHKALVLRLGWLLYIVLKSMLLPPFPDLISCMELLVCVMNVLVSHMAQLPPDIPRGPDGDVHLLDAMSDVLKADRAHVASLMTSVDLLFTQQLTSQCAEVLRSLQGPTLTTATLPGIRTSCSCLPGLFSDPGRMKAIADALDRQYGAQFARRGELDERDMLYTDFARYASPRMTPHTAYRAQPFTPGGGASQPPTPASATAAAAGMDTDGVPGSASKITLLGGPAAQAGQRLGPGSFLAVPSPTAQSAGSTPGGGGMAAHPFALGSNGTVVPQAHPASHAQPHSAPAGLTSPMPITALGPTAATPITEALGAASWLRHVTAGLRPEPSPILHKYFIACVPNPGATIAKRVKEMTEAVLPNEQQAMTAFPLAQPSIAAHRREEATKLYYHVLELVLASEERLAVAQGRPTSAPPCYVTLLTSSKLHKGLMACSLELVMACYRVVSCPFPRILDLLRLHAFDLIKIVQTYVRHMPGMPLELKRHLYLMEEKTVECLAWQTGSSLYPVIVTAMGVTGATSTPQPPAAADAASPIAVGMAGGGAASGGGVSPAGGAAQPVLDGAVPGGAVLGGGSGGAPAVASAAGGESSNGGAMEVQDGAGTDALQAEGQQVGPPQQADHPPGSQGSEGGAVAPAAAPDQDTPMAAQDACEPNTAVDEGAAAACATPAVSAAPSLAGPVAPSAVLPGARSPVPPSVPQASQGSHTPGLLSPGGPSAAPSPSKRPAGAAHGMMSPLKKARAIDGKGAIPTLPAPSVSEPLPPAVGRPPSAAVLAALHPESAAALTWLHDFLRKVLKLAWFRLGFLCGALSFGAHDPQHVRLKVYETVEHAVYCHTGLLYNRHLDQLLLSALYGYCKVQHLGSITFKEIIAQYRRQPQATQAVFRSVVLVQTNPGLAVQSRGDIIAFYNQVFVPLLKQYLLRGEAGHLHPSAGLPPIPPSQPIGMPGRPSAAGQSPRMGSAGVSPRGSFMGSPGGLLGGGGGGGSAGTSPLLGKPPLPPATTDALLVQQHIKQTIHGFFPPMPRPAAGATAGGPELRNSAVGSGGASAGPAPHAPPTSGLTGLLGGSASGAAGAGGEGSSSTAGGLLTPPQGDASLPPGVATASPVPRVGAASGAGNSMLGALQPPRWGGKPSAGGAAFFTHQSHAPSPEKAASGGAVLAGGPAVSGGDSAGGSGARPSAVQVPPGPSLPPIAGLAPSLPAPPPAAPSSSSSFPVAPSNRGSTDGAGTSGGAAAAAGVSGPTLPGGGGGVQEGGARDPIPPGIATLLAALDRADSGEPGGRAGTHPGQRATGAAPAAGATAAMAARPADSGGSPADVVTPAGLLPAMFSPARGARAGAPPPQHNNGGQQGSMSPETSTVSSAGHSILPRSVLQGASCQ